MSAGLSELEVPLLNSTVCGIFMKGHLEEIKSFLQGLSPDERDAVLHGCVLKGKFQGRGIPKILFTPLSHAAYFGRKAVVQLLVEDYSVDVDFALNMTALAAAAKGGHLEVVKYLVSQGCDVNSMRNLGQTAIHHACSIGNLEMAKYLHENGASIDIPDKSGLTCLMIAGVLEYVTLVQWLLDRGADVSKTDEQGCTALHHAALHDDDSTVEVLLAGGAVFVRNKEGCTPATFAAIRGKKRVLKRFAESARVSKEDKVEALELYGAMLGTLTHNMDIAIAFNYLHRAMVERYSDPNETVPKPASPLPVRSDLQESVSLEELEARRNDPNLFRFECWATLQRVLGLDNCIAWYTYRKLLKHLNSEERRQVGTSLLLRYIKSGKDPSADLILELVRTFLSTLTDALSTDTELPLKDWVHILGFILKTHLDNKDKLSAPAEEGIRLGVRWLTPSGKTNWLDKCLHCFLACLNLDPEQKEETPLTHLAEGLVLLSRLLRRNQCILTEAVTVIGDDFETLKNHQKYTGFFGLWLEGGADPNHKDPDGKTPLHLVAELAQEERFRAHLKVWVSIARLPLDAGALLGVRTREGKTALEFAASSPVRDVIQEFLPSSLKSLATPVVLDSKIQSQVPADLTAFVEQH